MTLIAGPGGYHDAGALHPRDPSHISSRSPYLNAALGWGDCFSSRRGTRVGQGRGLASYPWMQRSLARVAWLAGKRSICCWWKRSLVFIGSSVRWRLSCRVRKVA